MINYLSYSSKLWLNLILAKIKIFYSFHGDGVVKQCLTFGTPKFIIVHFIYNKNQNIWSHKNKTNIPLVIAIAGVD